MNSDKAINILPSHKIDKTKWDECIFNSRNAVIYAYSFYLDAMCENWSGIVKNDYDAVMPVPWKKKIGIRYCYQVPFIQQLGLFSPRSELNIEPFLTLLFKKWKYGDYSFNFQNKIQFSKSATHINYVLDLTQSYSQIESGYSSDIRANLKKAVKGSLVYTDSLDIKSAIQLYEKYYSERILRVKKNDFDNFFLLCNNLIKKKQALIRKVIDPKGRLLAVALLLRDDKRIYNILNVITSEGRDAEANHLLYDRMINEFAGSGLIFDFEGSDLPGVKYFYEKFGPQNQTYPGIRYNHLPFPVHLLKR